MGATRVPEGTRGSHCKPARNMLEAENVLKMNVDLLLEEGGQGDHKLLLVNVLNSDGRHLKENVLKK